MVTDLAFVVGVLIEICVVTVRPDRLALPATIVLRLNLVLPGTDHIHFLELG